MGRDVANCASICEVLPEMADGGDWSRRDREREFWISGSDRFLDAEVARFFDCIDGDVYDRKSIGTCGL